MSQKKYAHPGRPPLDRPKEVKRRLLSVSLTNEELGKLLSSLPKDTRERGLLIIEKFIKGI